MKREVKVKDIIIGGKHPITVQSMTNTITSNVEATVKQIINLTEVGADIVRVSVPDIESANALRDIVNRTYCPIVADIHYDYKLAIAAADNGAHKIRINPGNIGDKNNVKYLADYLRERDIPIRIGVNSGSIEKSINASNTAEALAESALINCKILEDCGFYNTIISVKSSSIKDTIDANRLLNKLCDYPLHLGVTEAGLYEAGIIKSSIGIGSLLNDGIGNTIRVSLTGDPVKEVLVARQILQYLELGGNYPEIISCPTCARTVIDVEGLANKINNELSDIKKHIKIAVMGCVVNGIGEGKDADIGVAGGKNKSVIFCKGQSVATIDNESLLEELMKRVKELVDG